ncbi:MAG: hypothetical protein IT395_05960 [Candidatus Omnitrophica bacterium]|nr:hypothetical protein [Candidatus Omnitrophota bacterium]
MIELKALKDILNIKDEELQKLDIEQLRALLGTFRYRVRSIEREINRRSQDNLFGVIQNSKNPKA